MDKWLNNTNVLKVISVAFATMLWLVVTMTPTDSVVPNKPIDTQYTYETKITAVYDENQYYASIKADTVLVTVKGSASVIESVRDGINMANSSIYVDLTNLEPGVVNADIKFSGFPKGATVTIEPKTAQVVIEQRHSKEMIVTIENLGTPATGVIVGAMTVAPEKVHVTGTVALVNQVAYVKAYLNVDGATELLSQELSLRALDKNGNFVSVGIKPDRVLVSLELILFPPYDEDQPGDENDEDENGENDNEGIETEE